MTSRFIFRGTTFNIPSNRFLWKKLGEYDSLVEFQEVASRLLLAEYNPSKESFRDYLVRVSKLTCVNLNDISLQNYRQIQYQGYLVFPNASFDAFLTDFAEDVRLLLNSEFTESEIGGCHFEKVKVALENNGIELTIDEAKIKLYHYYRHLRNDVAHRLDVDYATEYSLIDMDAIHGFYPNLAKPQPKSSLNFDDFVLCTANIKNMADEMTRSLLPHIDWVTLVLENKDFLLPKYRKFVAMNRVDRLKRYIKNCVHFLYGIKLPTSDIETIVGSLE